MTDSTMGSNLAGFVLVTCAVIFTLLSSASVSEARPNVFSRLQTVNDDNMFRSRRGPGFRQGAIDRVGHQFGKRSERSELDELLAPPEQPAEYVCGLMDIYNIPLAAGNGLFVLRPSDYQVVSHKRQYSA